MVNQEKKRMGPGTQRFVLSALYFCAGAGALITQIYCFRELLVVFFGNELFLGLLFGCWFAGICTGSWCVLRWMKDRKTAVMVFIIGILLLGTLPFVALVAARLLRYVVSLPLGGSASVIHMLWGTLLTVFPPACVIGCVFPAACRMLQETDTLTGRAIGWVYFGESCGSLVAGVAVSFWVLPASVPTTVVLGWCVMPLFAGAACIAFFSSFRLFGLCAILLVVGDAAAIGTGFWQWGDTVLRDMQWQTLGNGLRKVAEIDSRYQRITLAEADGQYSLFLNGTLWCTYPDPSHEAVRAHVLLTQHPTPRQVLILGSPATGMLAEVLHHPVASVDCVSLDPAIDHILAPILRREDRTALDDPRVVVHYQDGRLFVKTTPKRYDLVVVDVPDPATAFLNRLYTVDFFSEVRRILTPHGVAAIGMSSEQRYFSAVSAWYNGSLYHSLRHVFPVVLVVPGERNYFFGALQPGLVTEDADILARRYQERNIASAYFSKALFPFLVQREAIAFITNELEARGYGGRHNTDLYPISYFYNLALWDAVAGGSGLPQALLRMREYSVQNRWVGAAVALLGVATAMLWTKKRRQVRRAVLFLIAVTGGSVMALEIVLLYLFQNFYGYIYEKIGMLVAFCMVGLACGAGGARRLLAGRVRTEPWLSYTIILMTALLGGGAGCVLLTGALAASPAFFFCGLLFVLGLLGGALFLLGCHMLAHRGMAESSIAGWANAADHAGACFGAVLTGTVLMPLFGIAITCGTISMVVAAAGVMFWWAIRDSA
ncbi:MAG: hypothetical protein N3B18_03805 [Desulfobacterota bacterium]|nr:hypothetical protein [Thermodesulfobacteriota bacterium]